MGKRFPKSIIICTFFALLSILFLPSQFASANEVGKVLANGNLNVRNAPSIQGEIVGKLQDGDEVKIIEKVGEWLKISSKVGQGYVHGDYIVIHKANSSTNSKANSSSQSSSTANKSNTTTTNPSTKKVSVYVNGNLLTLPIDPPVENGRVLVPFRVIGENLGINVNWLSETKQIEAIDADTKVLFTINKNKVLVNSQTLTLDQAPLIVKNTTVIPLRFFAETYGANVQWNEKEKIVTIVKKQSNNGNVVLPMPSEEKPPSRTTVLAVIDDPNGATVYEEPSRRSDEIGELEEGDTIKIYEKPSADIDTDEWIEIDYKNKVGYIAADAVRPQSETLKGKVTATSLNIREQANTTSAVIGSLPKGQEIIVFEVIGEWARIKHNGQWGYVHTNYLTMQMNKKTYSALSEPKLEIYDANRAWLTWSKVGSVTTSHSLVTNGIEISTTASQIDKWKENHPGIQQIEYNGSKIRIYVNPGYHLVVRHFTNSVRVTILPSGLAGKRIVVDAGHGDHDPGAKGATGLLEKEVNLAVALKLADLLRNAGAEVILSRSNDTFLSLADRVKVAHNNDADAFISIHADSFNATSQGSTTFYHSGKNPSWQQSKQLSDIAIKKLTSQLGTVSRGSNDKSLHVIRETEIPAILVELAFLSNPKEEALLKSDEFRQKAAQALFDSFIEFYK
ncbi:N-acetylmuramoyl-L-alanine amidase [Calidifontibacillus erzurumensis]|uniref:N-acetylmuramoyl-L-alanine amidase n=1 Tax=Calidifontibacillus erzurumensis TaxID=2741433 RepID=A0A8J8GD83_9BACI|nr:N-acetylmuramoyl-L-alanine amidase [Calidifontibacillus erzurumensis]NSL51765.1 N-acetylmuramoyl-L-alanine amidase [Calidifontibacillus erzurumensis]